MNNSLEIKIEILSKTFYFTLKNSQDGALSVLLVKDSRPVIDITLLDLEYF
jgi:hypothetical protein